MSRHFKKDEFDMIYKIYNEFGLKKTINPEFLSFIR